MAPETLEREVARRLATASSHYDVLELMPEAPSEAIQPAFHEFSRRFHPDRHGGESEAVRAELRRWYARGAEAYRVLKNPKLRAEHDLELRKAAAERERGSARPAVRTLDELCATAGGRLHARQAARALDEGRLAEAARLLERALGAEGTNEELRERLASLRVLLDLAGEP
jgi:curved DNA-binding protein CbpA